MNYKEKYEQALERAKKYHQQLLDEDNYEWASEIEELFPELRESIDERVRKGLIKAVSGTLKGNKLYGSDVTREEALTWLEKQGQPRMQHGITINGVEYELIVDHEADECERCALKGQCNNIGDDTLCNAIFGSDIAAFHRFEKKTK